jgi:hypothetical protein
MKRIEAGRLAVALLVLGTARLAAAQSESSRAESTADMDRLRAEVGKLDGSIHEIGGDLKRELAFVRDRLSLVVATTFLQSPPPSSDVVGVAHVAVFAPHIEADNAHHRDVLVLRVRRVDASGLRTIGPDIEIASGQMSTALPVDQNGALYIVEWSTAEGYSYAVQLKDGATEAPVASVQVRPLQNRGRFMYVGYKLE